VAFNGAGPPAPHTDLTTDWQFVAVVYDGVSIRHYVDDSVLVTNDQTGRLDTGEVNLRIGGLPKTRIGIGMA